MYVAWVGVGSGGVAAFSEGSRSGVLSHYYSQLCVCVYLCVCVCVSVYVWGVRDTEVAHIEGRDGAPTILPCKWMWAGVVPAWSFQPEWHG